MSMAGATWHRQGLNEMRTRNKREQKRVTMASSYAYLNSASLVQKGAVSTLDNRNRTPDDIGVVQRTVRVWWIRRNCTYPLRDTAKCETVVSCSS